MAYNPNLGWDQEGMSIIILDKGKEVMRFFLGEAMEGAGRKLIEDHIKEIERSPWITTWHPKKEKV